MTNKHLGNQTSAALQMDEGVKAESKDNTNQQCGWFSRNLLLALTIIGVLVCVCVCACMYACVGVFVHNFRAVCDSFLGSSVD